MSIAARVALDKERHPEDYCPVVGCLWRIRNPNTGEHTPCGKHTPQEGKR